VALMARLRAAIITGEFAAVYAELAPRLAAEDPTHPPGPPPQARRARALTRGGYAIDADAAGRGRMRHVASGEVMHSVNDPDAEAAALYVAQPRAIAAALAGPRADAPLVVWDVGLGAGHNAMALVHALDAAPGHGAVELVSFERDLDALALALAHPRAFPHLRHPAPHRLLARDRFERSGLRWTLVRGALPATLADAPAPDVIWWDPFSAKVDDALWTAATFAAVAARLTRPCALITYSRSTAVRTALLAAGFHVARGAAVGRQGRDHHRAVARRAGARPRDARAARRRVARPQRARSTAAYPADVGPRRARRHRRAHRRSPAVRGAADLIGGAGPYPGAPRDRGFIRMVITPGRSVRCLPRAVPPTRGPRAPPRTRHRCPAPRP
jgi:tRNA U34 5-methylaminomethyl-2-thiouridine-forming methyltransferase MnmC